MSETQVKTDSGDQLHSESGNRSFFSSCWIKAALALIVLVVGLVILQSYLAPEVEDNKTVQITQGGKASSNQAKDPAESELDRPKGLTGTVTMKKVNAAEHPLDPLMELADRGLEIIEEKYPGYSAKLLSQVRTGDTLHDENLMLVKIRHAREASDDNEKKVPFSIYTHFLKPKSKVGQEAIWVEGKDDEKILGHGTGLLNIKTVSTGSDRLVRDERQSLSDLSDWSSQPDRQDERVWQERSAV